MNTNHIYIDTNILIGAYAGNITDRQALDYLYSLKGKRLFSSSLSVSQLISVFQKHKIKKDIRDIVKQIMHKINILSCTKEDIQAAIEHKDTDIEDNIQYVISGKMRCFYVVTNNKNDFSGYSNIYTLTAKSIRGIKKD